MHNLNLVATDGYTRLTNKVEAARRYYTYIVCSRRGTSRPGLESLYAARKRAVVFFLLASYIGGYSNLVRGSISSELEAKKSRVRQASSRVAQHAHAWSCCSRAPRETPDRVMRATAVVASLSRSDLRSPRAVPVFFGGAISISYILEIETGGRHPTFYVGFKRLTRDRRNLL